MADFIVLVQNQGFMNTVVRPDPDSDFLAPYPGSLQVTWLLCPALL